MENLDTWGLVESALDQLRSSGLDGRLLTTTAGPATQGADGIVELTRGHHRETLLLRVKTGLRPATAAVTLQQMSDPGSLLVADRIAGRVAELARELKVNYVDATGNAWICTPGLLIDIRGRSLGGTTTNTSQPSTFTKTDLRVILTVVNRELAGNSNVTARELAAAANVSHGAAHLTVQKLRTLGFLYPGGLRRGAKLLDQWTEAYLARGGAHKAARTLCVEPNTLLREGLAQLPSALVSGEWAGEALGWPIRPASALVYAPAFTEVARRLQGSSQGPGLPVEVRTPAFSSASSPTPGIAAAMLVRADMLMSTDPRQVQVAQEVIHRDENLRRLREIA